MANGVDFSRLRRQNLFANPEIPDLSGGTMDLSGVDFGANDYLGEGPLQPGSSYQFGEVNLPDVEFGRGTEDPRAPINPSIVGGPNSRGASEADDLLKIINSIYTPEYTSRDRFNRLLDAAPERESPGFARSLTAAGMSLGAKDPMDALNVQERVMYAPHARNIQDWQAKTQPFGQAAQFENTSNVNERTLATNVGTNLVNQRRYDQQNQINQEKNDIATFRAESDRIRQRAYAYAQSLGKGWGALADGPTVIMYNKDTGERMDTGMETGKLTEEAKIELQNLGRVNAAAAFGQNAATTAGINQSERWVDRQGNVYNLNPSQVADAATMGLRPITPGAPQFPSGPITRVPNNAPQVDPKDQQLQEQIRWNVLYNTDLEARQWMTRLPNGTYSLKNPPSGWFGMSPNADAVAAWQRTQDKMFPNQSQGPIQRNQDKQQTQPQLRIPQENPRVGPSSVPVTPQGQPGVVGGQQRYMQPPVDFSNPPSTRTGVGGVQQQLGTPTQPQQQSAPTEKPTREQIMAEVQAGRMLVVKHQQTGQIGYIQATQAEIEDAMRQGFRVQVGQ